MDAVADLEFVRLAVNAATPQELSSFQKTFFELFPRATEFMKNPSKIHDPSVFLRAFLIMVSIAMLSLSVECDENIELVPFLKVVCQDQEFSSSMQSLAVMLFGVSAHSVRHFPRGSYNRDLSNTLVCFFSVHFWI